MRNLKVIVMYFQNLLKIKGKHCFGFVVSLKNSPRGYKTFPCSTNLSTEFILLIHVTVKMPTIVGILTFISMINKTSERLKAKYFLMCRYFSFYEQFKVCAQLS